MSWHIRQKILVLIKLFSRIFCLIELDEPEGLTENDLTQHWRKKGSIEKNIKSSVSSVQYVTLDVD